MSKRTIIDCILHYKIDSELTFIIDCILRCSSPKDTRPTSFHFLQFYFICKSSYKIKSSCVSHSTIHAQTQINGMITSCDKRCYNIDYYVFYSLQTPAPSIYFGNFYLNYITRYWRSYFWQTIMPYQRRNEGLPIMQRGSLLFQIGICKEE